MTGPGRKRTFTTAATTAATAEGQPPAPAPSPRVSDIPSKEASNIGHQQGSEDYSLDALIGGRPDPDLDLVTKSYAIPRYLAEALRMENVRSRRPQQALVADALRAHLPAAIVEACRRKAERD